ncbi:hypothetical protein [Vibrio sp. HN007]|uniref:hypothetical protein n=1 Tax=Vibrio iocasae TaxID=3098914 RepID=UPI0035D4481A
MGQLAEKLNTKPQETAPSAEASIQACKALFGPKAIRKKIKNCYDKLTDKERGMILIAGGLMPAREHNGRSFDDFTDIELEQIRQGMNFLKEMNMKIERRVGDVRKLKHSQFSNTH